MTGELLTRGTIWLAMVAYVFGACLFALSGRRSRWDSAARVLWTVACASLVAHFISAFQFYHDWSHESAYRETARQTKEVFRLNWGGGLFINYALLAAWIADIGWWWRSGLDSYRRRPGALLAGWHGFLVFIIFNATVVFKDGLVRWLGLCICVVLCLAGLRVLRTRSTQSQPTN